MIVWLTGLPCSGKTTLGLALTERLRARGCQAEFLDGDVIRRIRQHKDYLGHIHTAGNPGRGELDDHQEIAYKPIMEALVEVGYQGFVGQEFIPTRDAYAGLWQAVSLCDV